MADMEARTTLDGEIRDLLRARIPLARELDELPDTLLLGAGGLGLDSIALVELLLDYEERFHLPPSLPLLDGPPLTIGALADHARSLAGR
jgi:acyl carrier protein